MAVLARRTWSDLKSEHRLRVGRESDSAYATRAERFIEAAYFDICTYFHHYELEAEDDSSLTEGNSTLTAATDILVLMSVWVENGGDKQRDLEVVHARQLERERKTSNGTVRKVARIGANLAFDRPTDTTVDVHSRYIQRPAAPDFSSGSPAIGREWDEHILDLSVALGFAALGIPGVEGPMALLERFIQLHPGTALKQGLSSAKDFMPQKDDHAGGAQS